jgi:hypothetical protein
MIGGSTFNGGTFVGGTSVNSCSMCSLFFSCSTLFRGTFFSTPAPCTAPSRSQPPVPLFPCPLLRLLHPLHLVIPILRLIVPVLQYLFLISSTFPPVSAPTPSSNIVEPFFASSPLLGAAVHYPSKIHTPPISIGPDYIRTE